VKKISKGYYIAAALLVLWAAVDLYHYAAIGRGLIEYYDGSGVIRRLVGDSLAQALVKILLAIVVIMLGWWRSRKEEGKHTRAATAIALRFGGLLFGVWFLCMAILTLGTAQYVLRDLSDSGIAYAEDVAMAGSLTEWFSPDDEYAQQRRNMPGAAEYNMNRAIAWAGRGIRPPSYDGYPPLEKAFSVFDREYVECDTAILVLDKEGNILRESGDYIYFRYVSQEQWETGGDETSGYAWIDISDEEDPRYAYFRTSYAGTRTLHNLELIRITGYMDGSRIEPLAMAFSDQGAYYHALDAASPGWNEDSESGHSEMTVSEDGKSATVSVVGGTSAAPPYSVSELDAMGLLEWEERFDYTAQNDPARELVTIYARSPGMTLYQPEGTVRYRTEEHDNLLALLKTMGYYQDKGRNKFYAGASQFSLWNMIVFSSYGVYDLREYDPSGSEPLPDTEYTIMTAMQASPVKIAMTFLLSMYLLTFNLMLLGFGFVNRRIQKHMIEPLQLMNTGMAENWTHIFPLKEKEPKWEELHTLWEHYQQTQDALQDSKNERIRLKTALEYARTAEETRRQMTSNIAHELKTPLAVIHSYAEGLKEHIAEEKRDKYIDVILTEAERMDGMVLEMLDLSRLEAGKVKLSRDEFSLISLTRAVFEKLDMAAQAKELQIAFSFPEDFTITADEGRMAQVIENFATNAIKYTPAGGHVWVTIQRKRSGVAFSIENDSEPLSGQALRKVWDTFYRTDEARSGGGTGLGLAIAKHIIELHGGKCSVRNTAAGVIFGFEL